MDDWTYSSRIGSSKSSANSW